MYRSTETISMHARCEGSSESTKKGEINGLDKVTDVIKNGGKWVMNWL